MRIVTAAAIIEKGSLLIARRGCTSDHEGLWELPGGKVEKGETPEECLVRELYEELGVEVDISGEFARSDIPGKVEPMELLAFDARIIKGRPKASVHTELRWVGPDELGEYAFCPADVPIVTKLKARMEEGMA
ncbi:MAG TPA: (deoxy)nucleoside triphosphate pyrophosphohydrolase [Bacillota bacterium]|nr:(deoxy)nucleoside triphosphate pyrophosphohydrolase [Bacillota bacterium]HOH10922.1 (deoxy)nucleoside triphosphate pyrophosphohydrolase [Bacillota bacterium]HOS50179.1 (deoxy)nucleoside triphosphate pyrophosphohydrolase [Bacillota bacterium]HPI01904.1 (deoxy)nucleoside triphosphate pyrophosphohydrolase [Bacillota bacterium]HPM64107.1 (deoxy)nucleoside triphosphate pyrophosphohydrolase [Bacillota bacterium]